MGSDLHGSDPVTVRPTIADIEAARERLAGVARETPLYPTETFSRLAGRPVLLKAREPPANRLVQDPRRLQHDRDARRRRAPRGRRRRERRQPRPGGRVGRARSRYPGDDLHAAGRADGEGRGDTRSYGGATELTGESFEEAVAAAQAHVERTGATLVHAFEDERVIAGQGTIGLELAEQAPEAETVLVPVGGGGLAAGIALALKDRRPGARVLGVVCQAGLHDRGRHRGEASAVSCPRRSSSTSSTT